MELTEYNETLFAFDGRIILRLSIAVPMEICDTATRYIAKFADKCRGFAENELYRELSREYCEQLTVGGHFIAYLYRFTVTQAASPKGTSCFMHAELLQGGKTIAERTVTVKFESEYLVPQKPHFFKSARK